MCGQKEACQADEHLVRLTDVERRPLELARLLEGGDATCDRLIVVCDNPNTHTKGALYDAFDPQRPQAHVRRIE